MYYVTMEITFLTRKFRNGERNLHCDVVHITTKWVSSLTLDCNGVFAIKSYSNICNSSLLILKSVLNLQMTYIISVAMEPLGFTYVSYAE